MTKNQKHCQGCGDDFYNGPNSANGKTCWGLKSARVVTRYKIGWWVEPTRPGAFTKVKTYSCHNETGKHGFYEELPDCAVDARGLR